MVRASSQLVFAGLVGLAACSGCALWHNDDGYGRYSDEAYEMEALRPIGARQKYHVGKLWPPYPRPAEEQAELSHRFHHAHYWPLPYVCYDREYVRNVLATQHANGWIAETTLYEYHFDPETLSLNHAGRLHLHWILQDVPISRRFVWVQTDLRNEISQQRLAIVQAAATEMIGPENLPPIMLRPARPCGAPAGDIDLMNRSWIQTMPEPRIEYTPLPSGVSQGG